MTGPATNFGYPPFFYLPLFATETGLFAQVWAGFDIFIEFKNFGA